MADPTFLDSPKAGNTLPSRHFFILGQTMEKSGSSSSSEFEEELENACPVLVANTVARRKRVWVHQVNLKRKEKGELYHLVKELKEHPSRYEILSERNCVEIITKLIEHQLLDVVFTVDGKEYVTPQQLSREIRDELFVHGGTVTTLINKINNINIINNYSFIDDILMDSLVYCESDSLYHVTTEAGRINLVELARILNVDLSQVTARAAEVERSDSGISLVLGQLIDKTYLTFIAQEINERLAQNGQVSVGDLTRQYDLPSDFLQTVRCQTDGPRLTKVEGRDRFTKQSAFVHLACGLSGVFAQVVEKQLGKLIHGKQDKSDPRVFFTESYVTRNTACVRGALAAATRPTPVSTLLSQCDVPERMFFCELHIPPPLPFPLSQHTPSWLYPSVHTRSRTRLVTQSTYVSYVNVMRVLCFSAIIDSLMHRKQVPGVVTGKQAGSSIYVPTIYSKSQNDWVNGFYRQNGYLEYDALSRLGISDPKTFVSKHFPGEKLLLLSTCAVGKQLFEQVEASVEEAVTTGSWIDVMPILPSVFEPEDAEEIVTSVLKTKPAAVTVHVFCSTVVVTDSYLNALITPLESVVQAKAQQSVSSGAYMQAQAESKIHNNKGHVDQEEGNNKTDRREERRKKAAGGKTGGGVQGRETKTKSTKKKYHRGGKTAAEDSDDEDAPPNRSKGSKGVVGGGKLELVTVSDIREVLRQVESLRDEELEELVDEIAAHLHPAVNKSALMTAQSLFESTLSARAHDRRKTHGELQDKLNALLTNVRLFEKGLKQFESKETQQQLAKYLLKTLCTEIANEIFAYVAAENMIQYDQDKEITAEVRTRIANEAPNNATEPLQKLHKCLTGSSVDDYLACVEVALGNGICDMILRKLDKRKERPMVHSHRQALLEQLSTCTDPALVLHLASLLLFQAVSQTMLHASGRFVSNILAHLASHLTAETFNSLQLYHDLVLKLLSSGEESDGRAEIMQALESKMPEIKEIAIMFKKKSVSEKQ
uniref:E3 UFM1-protein ligase 1 homolog n=1 Tax=Timema tahoe TaxID=61484 RepID=A0A7R9IJ20_9NEOP|nr:unnamed protein product [Timema tahoe]